MATCTKRCVNNTKQGLKLALIIASTLTVSACAQFKHEPIVEGNLVINDPLEEYNRDIFAFNQAVDKVVINPVIKGYRAVAPKPARTGIRNVLRNLRSPVNFINEVLQGDFDGAGKVFVRTAINSTLGIGGLFDLAGHEGIEYESEDFGQTLAVWGVGHGAYVVVPFIGPSSTRDYLGYFTDSMMDPLRWYLFNIDEQPLYYSKLGADYLDIRDSLYDVLQELDASSIDYYASVRSTYYQQRQAQVLDQTSQFSAPSIPDYDDDL